MEKNKINQAITKQLFSENIEEVLSAIKRLNKDGNKDYLPALFEVLNSTPEESITNSIGKLLCTIKDSQTIPVFISALKEEKYKNIRKNIVSACWQNGLDFSDYINDFVDLVISENWETAFEAFTVIDNFTNLPPEKKLAKTREKVESAIKDNDGQKKYLLEEILKLSSR